MPELAPAVALPSTTPALALPPAWAGRVVARSSLPTGLLVSLLCPAQGARAFRLIYGAFRVFDDRIDAPGRTGAELAPLARTVEAALLGSPGVDPACVALALVLGGPHGARLAPAVHGMWAAQRYDIQRRDGPAARPAAELEAQRVRIGDAYLHALWVCSGAPGAPPNTLRGLARAATGAHWLRDLEADRDLGYCNVPAQVLADAGVTAQTVERSALAPWLGRRRAVLRAELRSGLAALGPDTPWRTRCLLRLLSWRYGRLIEVP